jgi:dTDP-4-dehydrorhamnose 3,5-epimerase-like enzyme
MLINIIKFKKLGDIRGSLVALEDGKDIPFRIKRVYYIYGTKEGVSRGFHAHKELSQVAICINGSCKFLLDNGNKKENILLNTPEKGLLIEKMVWREMYDFSDDCILMVLASEHYDESDYIRDYDEFLEALN